MGKCNVVIDFGAGKTKIGAFEKKNNKYELKSGAVIETGENSLSSPELLQNISSFLLQMHAGSGNLFLILPDSNEDVITTSAEFPIGANKEIDGMIKNNISALISDNFQKYHYSWRYIGNSSDGLGEFQIAAVNKHTVESIAEIADKYKLKLISADLVSNAVENLTCFLQKNGRLSPKAVNEAMAFVEVGYKNVRVSVFTRDAVIRTKSFNHDLYRMDKLIYDNLGDLSFDKKIIPEYLKMNPSFTLKIKQYQNFIHSVTSDIIMQIKRCIGGETLYRLAGIYFGGGMYKMPQLVSIIKDSFNIPCYAFPINDLVEFRQGCILTENNKPYPSEEIFAASVGALVGGV